MVMIVINILSAAGSITVPNIVLILYLRAINPSNLKRENSIRMVRFQETRVNFYKKSKNYTESVNPAYIKAINARLY